ncbi:GNAT family acetyltransferase [Brevibacillus nitrificans]|uniref:GNAT family acetyltransferase n=1 Tax=Brevibacillus nitrificans TaxID=651560 RepID=A0A3M8D4Y5_9BACL|nr:GNAT family acetyltransferase [Brevibacillus nitrificans]RNB83102.1 GNAT family acetyltransferase [Brevibacillus nitrificans]
MNIRSFSLEQWEEVVTLWRRAGIQLSRSDTPAGIQKKLERDPQLFLIAETEEGRIIGAVMGSYDGRRGWINHLAVDPDCQGQDLGTRLLQELEQRLAGLGCDKINLLIEPENGVVQAFYEKQGFNRDELIFMEKWITPAQTSAKGV